MALILKWLFRAFVSVLALSAVALIGAYYFASRSLPDYQANYKISGLTAPLEIVRDAAAVPHIMGATEVDSFFGLGFVHAQDRLWQMTLLRRTAQGKLSEIFGERTVPIDDFMRRIDLAGAANASLDVQSLEALRLLQAYSDGVNAWIAQVNTDAMGRGAPEFFLFSPQIAPWQPQDSIAVGKVMALQLTDHMKNEILRARLSLALAPNRVSELMPDAPGGPIIALPDLASIWPTLPDATQYAGAQPRDPLHPVKPYGMAGASNAWAAMPGRTASGGTLLANDPHLELSAPSVWYLARMQLDHGGVIGGTIPGIPTILVGRSDQLGWGLTVANIDDQDLFLERLNPDNPDQYQTPDGYKEFEAKRSVIQVKDAAPVTITTRWSDNGPIISSSHFGLGNITPAEHVMALSWTALSHQDTSVMANLGIMKSQTVPEAQRAGRLLIAPGQNLTLADSDGIALQVIGKQPARNRAHQSLGRLPTPGWRVENRWTGHLPYRANPRVVAPVSGLVGNTNNKTTDAAFPEHLSFDWLDTQRIKRWTKLMQDRQIHTRDSFVEAQLDTVSVTARTLLPLIARDLWFDETVYPNGTTERVRQDALRLLANWNGTMNEHLPEPLIYAAWVRELFDSLARDELGPLIDDISHPDPVFLEKVFRNTDGASAWCDVVQSTATETCTQIARRALDAALQELRVSYGNTIAAWRWGDAHQAHHDHQILGELPFLGPLVNIRQSTSGGDHTMQRAKTLGTGETPFANVHAAGYRGVYDFADPDSSLFVIATGQSGHPLSRHYDDLGELWRRGEYIPMSLDIERARAGGEGVTILTPK